MKKISFFIFGFFLTATSYAADFSVTCDDTAGNGCILSGNFQNYLVTKCSEIKALTPDKPIIIDTDKAGCICDTSIQRARKGCKELQTRYIDHYYAIFCDTDGYINTIGTKYDGIKDVDLSYAEKKCRGSGGEYTNGGCTCPNEQTTPTDGECLCKSNNKAWRPTKGRLSMTLCTTGF